MKCPSLLHCLEILLDYQNNYLCGIRTQTRLIFSYNWLGQILYLEWACKAHKPYLKLNPSWGPQNLSYNATQIASHIDPQILGIQSPSFYEFTMNLGVNKRENQWEITKKDKVRLLSLFWWFPALLPSLIS